MPTSREIARLAGVSQATVSRVLQGSEKVSLATRDRVNDVMRAVGYVPNAQARAMRTSRSGVIGVVTGRIQNPFYPELLHYLAAAITASDRRMALWTSDETSGEAAAIDAIRSGQVDGLVFTTVTGDSSALIGALEAGLPVVLANRTLDDVGCDQLASDNPTGGAVVARYFLAHGRTDAAVVGGNEVISTGSERRRGFMEEFARAGHDIPERWRPETDFTHDAAHEVGMRLLDGDQAPSAVFCVNDLVALGVLDAARRRGIAVPQDLWVVGYDDIPMAAWDAFDLTTVRQPIDRMAQLAVERLLARIDDPSVPVTHTRFAPELVVRGSTAHALA